MDTWTRARTLILVLVVGAAAVPSGVPATAHSGGATTLVSAAQDALPGWDWPLASFRVVEPFRAPAHEYGPGHRGVDLHAVGSDQVYAPAAGIIAFSGMVAGRGVVTIDHGDGLVTTLEPVLGTVAVGTTVYQGQPVATRATGGHTPPGAIHFGVRRNGRYINPLLLLGGVLRAVLLPCC